MIISIQYTKLRFGGLKIAFANENSTKPSSLAAGRFLRQGQKAATLFAKIPRMGCRLVANIVFLR